MNTNFVRGDVLLYFNSEVVYIVLLDEITESHFTIITSQNGRYQYGFKIKIKNLTSKWFIKLDSQYEMTPGVWEVNFDETCSKVKFNRNIEGDLSLTLKT
jgi:hypothetical protein